MDNPKTLAMVPKQSEKTRDEREWELLQRQCTAFMKSGFLPEEIKRGATAEEVVAKTVFISMVGKELGLSPMQSFRSIQVIKGKPAISAEAMLGLVYRRCPEAKIQFLTPPEKAHLECLIETERPGQKVERFRFTLEDAKVAGLIGNTSWQKYPAAMLRARCISAMCRAVYPDAIMGFKTPEEYGVEVVDAELERAPAVQEVQSEAETETSAPLPSIRERSEESDRGPEETPLREELRELRNEILPEEVHVPPPVKSQLVTPKQLKLIWFLAREHKWGERDVYDFVKYEFDKEHLQELNWTEVDKVIAHLKSRQVKDASVSSKP